MTPDSGPGGPSGTAAIAMPAVRRGQKLAFSFDEDEVTLAWDAVHLAGLPPGGGVAAEGLDLPAWFWKGTRLVLDAAASTKLRLVATGFGPAVVAAHEDADVEAEAARRHAGAPIRTEREWQDHRLARDGPDTEADYPLGAHVTAARHDEVLAERMRLPVGTVESWTSIGAGAAPSEFARLQQAVGAYHVVLVALPDGRRTVGIWAGPGPPSAGQRARPLLRRLFRQQGAWRHGVKFGPLP